MSEAIFDGVQAAAADSPGRAVAWPDVVVAAVAGYLHRVTGAPEVVLGLPLSGRLGSAALRAPATAVNVVPLRVRVSPYDAVGAVAERVAVETAAVRRRQRTRSERIRRELHRLGTDRPLYGPQVNVLPFGQELRFGPIAGRMRSVATGPVEDLSVTVRRGAAGAGLQLEVEANPALYSTDDLAGHARRLLAVLTAVARPHGAAELVGRLDLLTQAERAAHAVANDTGHDVPDVTLLDLVEAAGREHADRPAVVFEGAALTHRELHERAGALAEALRARGAAPGRIVAVTVPRCAELIVSLLAVLKSGAAYVPLDPDYPPDRLALMLADADPVCLLTADDVLAAQADVPVLNPFGAPWDLLHPRVQPARNVPEARNAGFPDLLSHMEQDDSRASCSISECTDRAASGLHSQMEQVPRDAERHPAPADPAYLLYTSGSTGRPKGVLVGHRAIVNRLLWMRAEYDVGPADRILQKTPSSFDVSVWEFFLPLLTGATLVVAKPGGHRDPAYLAGLVRDERITLLHFVPSMLRAFLDEIGAEPANLSSLRAVICSGEALPAELVDRLAGVPVHNLYGPTEAAVDVTYHPCTPGEGDPVPIGRPVWNTRLHILDGALQPVPDGAAGELYLAGVQLAAGYRGRPDLTGERFTADPYGPPGSRMYRTGDLARRRPDGAVEFLGRVDGQVKIRGVRIEPAEVEAVLAGLPGVRAAAVTVRDEPPYGPRLIGYVVGEADLDQLRTQLPAALVPAALVGLDALPLTPSGKLDRRALPSPGAAPGEGEEGRLPDGPVQELLCRLFADELGVERVGPDDGFFDLGGHSLLAVRLAGRVKRATGRDCRVGTVFAAPTPALLTTALDTGTDGALGELLPLRPAGRGAPLFCLPPAGGLAWCYAGLLAALPGRPVYGIQSAAVRDPDAAPADLAELADGYLRVIRSVRPHGPYHLLGWSIGGLAAQQLAVRLRAAGERVGVLAMLDAYPGEQWRLAPAADRREVLTGLLRIGGLADPPAGTATLDEAVALLREHGSAVADLPRPVLAAMLELSARSGDLMRDARHERYDGEALFVRAAAPRRETWLDPAGWAPHLGRIRRLDLDRTHSELVGPAALAELGAVLGPLLEEEDR